MERRDVIRSKERLREAYLDLLFEHGDTKITVNEVLEKADLSRGTFYAHYRDISDLHNAVEDMLVEKWRKTFKYPTQIQLTQNPREPLDCLLSKIEPHKKAMKILLKKENQSNLIRQAKEAMVTLMKEECTLQNKDECELLQTAIAGAVIDSFVFWVISDNPLPREVFIDKLCDFISSGITSWNAK
ncbi:MAG: TetR/AcrR family transcriptional regulator [Lachnospiraceae bacterium]|nr:TetR/AcrR family transcriptional regulator [Lachnospiraceae bacterium]